MTEKTNHKRLWSRLMAMAKLGATPNGGCNRQALTDLDSMGRSLLIEWANEIGCSHHYDEIGNLFIRREGQSPQLPVILVGSHLDTQPSGGKFDGVYGVLGGLEVLHTLTEKGIDTQHSIELVVWTNEEGCRFDCAMMGSAVWTQSMPLQLAYDLQAFDNQARVEDELIRLGQKGQVAASYFPIKAAFELHIEQGPILELEKLTIGVVKGAQHMSRHNITVWGQEAHAGPTPMSSRRDPMMALSLFLPKLYQLAEEYSPDSRITFGTIDVEPASPNTVPGKLMLTMDIRHPDLATYLDMLEKSEQIISQSCGSLDLEFQLKQSWHAPGVEFSDACIVSVQQAVDDLGYSNKTMVSGAGHDAVNLARIVNTSMIFIPCRDGLSHNEAEYASPTDVGKGADVLLNAILSQAV
ncbi:M20 family metallo-hydrolase [Shewanella psychropiezotolerans]|uniref:M20 family metallo-hydrolase n=1 Tax=Shewanella psychropiezotolerans TaxID=2593655 RepID=A0ABX5WYD6_9GAMM|nr:MULTISPECIES: M20 family metallo-hydrolase [Shewanella]MPY22460.1 M20 family metallo-hydrolase [Shewanella sp. YLB-07]QDO83227.1 M20 family metallo-hydrolase [Shewanella psychropiezotolerans]